MKVYVTIDMHQGLVDDVRANLTPPVVDESVSDKVTNGLGLEESDEYWDNGAKTFEVELED